MKITKKVLSVLLSLMLVLGAVAVGGMSVSAEPEGNAELIIGDVCAIEGGDILLYKGTGWSITVNEDENGVTLNLDNLNLEPDFGCIYAQYLDLTITGSAKLTATGDVFEAIAVSEGNLTLNGDFALSAQCDTGGALGVDGNLTVEGGSLSVINTGDNNAISTDTMTVNGGSVYAKTESSSYRAISPGLDLILHNGEAFALGDEMAKEVLIKVPGQPPYITGDIIEYGTYPQSRVTDETTVAALNEKLSDGGWVSYGYYSGTGSWNDGQMVSGDWMRYQDAVLDGVKYRAVQFTDYRSMYTGYPCTAGNTYQEDNGYNTDMVYWFKFEPIEWRVLDSDSGLVMSETIIDSQAYNNFIIRNSSVSDSTYAYFGDSAETYYASDYANSSIRAWLNDDFYNIAFSDEQKSNIETTTLNNDGYYTLTGLAGCEALDSAETEDKIFILSYDEVINSNYGFSSSDFDPARQAKGSDYAKCQGLYVFDSSGSSYDGCSYWRLRSPGYSSRHSCGVSGTGDVSSDYYTYFTSNGVRPALKLQNLKSDPTGAPVIVKPEMTVTVTPQNPASDGTFTLTVNLPDDATGNVIIRFNEVDLLGYIKLAEGNSQQFNCLRSGTYHGTAKYMPGDGSNYKEVTVEFSFRVSAAAPNMTLTAKDITYGENATVTANLPTDTMWGSVTFYLDNADTGKAVYISQGKAVCTFSDLNAGEHTVEAVFANDDKYADETKTVTFNVEQKELTITANDQTYPFNGQIQGEGNTAYEGPGEKVTVEDLIPGDTLSSIILDGQAKDIGEYPDSVVPSSAQIKNSGGQDVTTNYNITYTSGKLTITSVNAPLAINYVYANGGEAAETHTEDVEIFTGYSVTSPAITGYTPDKETVEGTMENLNGVTETVTYTAIEYTATFVDENGENVGEVKFTVEDDSIDEPEVPAKEGYEGKWSEYTIAAGNMEITAQYTAIEYTATFTADGETVAEIPYTVETEKLDAPAVPEKEGFTGEWEEYELTPGGITVNAVYTEIIPENLCPLDNEDHGDGFFGRVRTFIHTLIWKAFRFLGLDVFFKVS